MKRRRATTAAILCSFSSGIEEMPRRKQGSIEEVLKVLHAQKIKRYSAFEATANMNIASTMTRLHHEGYIEDAGGAYPWTNYKLTEKGLRAIGATR